MTQSANLVGEQSLAITGAQMYARHVLLGAQNAHLPPTVQSVRPSTGWIQATCVSPVQEPHLTTKTNVAGVVEQPNIGMEPPVPTVLQIAWTVMQLILVTDAQVSSSGTLAVRPALTVCQGAPSVQQQIHVICATVESTLTLAPVPA